MKACRSFALFLAAAASTQLHAGSLSWDPAQTPLTPSGGTGTWDLISSFWSNGTTDANWTDTTGKLDIAVFGSTAGTVTLGTNLGAKGLAFNSSGYTLTGSTLTLGGSGINASALVSGTTTIGSAVSLVAGSQTWNTGVGSTLAVNGPVTRAGGAVLSLATGGTYSSTSLTNTNSIIGPWATTGTGTSTRYATLSGGNLTAYTGATVLSAATAWGGMTSGGTGTVNYQITSAGTPGATGLNRNINSLLYSGTGLTQGGNNNGLLLNTNGILNVGTGALVIGVSVNQFGIAAASTATNQMVLSAASADITINADIRNNLTNASSVVTTGPGTVNLAANNSFTGDLHINSGTLIASRSNNVNNPVTSSLGNPLVARNVAVHSGGTLSMTGADLLGSATTTPLCTLIINEGGLVTNNGTNFISFGPIVMNGGQLTTSGGAAAGYQSYNLMSGVTVGGNSPSSISVNGAGNLFNGLHLNTNTLFTVADATADSSTDLLVSAPLINRNNSLTGAGGFTKAGTGTMTLTGNNIYSGPTTITDGTLQIGDGVTNGSIAPSSGITNNAKLVYHLTGSDIYAFPVTGTGTLSLMGGGNLTLPAANNLGGATTIEDGGLRLNGTFGAVIVADNPNNLIGNTIGGSLFLASLTFEGDATADVDLYSGPSPINVSGALTTTPASGLVVLTVTAPALANGIYNLISYGSFSGSTANFIPNASASLNARQSASVVLNGSHIAIQVQGDSPKWTGLDGASWQTGSTGPNSNWKFVTAGTATNYLNGDYTLFDDGAAGVKDVNIDNGDVSPRTALFSNNISGYTLSGGTLNGFGIIAGSLTKEGAGALTVSSNNLLPEGVTFNGGILNLNSATALGSGTLTIGPDNTFPGSTRTLNNTSGSAITNAFNNAQIWNEDFTFTGSNDLDLGSGPITAGGDGSSRVVNIASGTLAVGEIKAPGHGLTKDGAGTLMLTSTGAGADASTLAGTFHISAGTLQINRSGADVAGSGDLTATGISGSGTITNGASVDRWVFINTTGDHTFPGTLTNGGSGGLGFCKQGTGSVLLSGALNYTGQTTVEGGTLTIAVANNSPGTNAVVNSGTLVMAHPQAFGTTSTLRLAGNNVSTLDIATDGGNNLYGFVLATGVNSTILSNRANEGEGLNHTLSTVGINGIGGGTITVASGSKVTSGQGRITFNQFDFSAGALAQTTLVNPTTANVTLGNVSKVAELAAQTLGLGGTSTDNAVTGLISDGTAMVAVFKSNSSTWTISGANNTYTGTTNIGTANGAGILRATASGALGTGTLIFDGSGGNPGPTSRLELSNDIVLNNAIDLHQRNNSSPIILNVSGNNTLSGNINLTFGGNRGNIESDAGLLTLSGTISTTTTITRNLHLGGNGNGAVTGPIIDNVGNPLGVLTVNKNGDGTWTLSGANTYSGATTVNAGTLSITQPSLSDSAAVNIAPDALLNLNHGGTDIVDRLFIDGTEQAPGTWGSLASSATNKTARITGSGILSVTNGVSGYGSWASSLGLTQGVNDASTFDAENDGFDNGPEYLLGGHPLDGSNNPKIHSLIADSSADVDGDRELIMTIAVPQGTPAFSAGAPESTAVFEGYTIAVRGSTNLTSFPVTVTPVAPVITGLPAAPVQGGITYEYRSFSLNGSNGTPGKGFLQVMISHP